jgi:hypothetical protein
MKQGLGSKVINGIALAIGLEDVIFRFQEQGWTGNVQGSLGNIAADYSLGLSLGSFDLTRAARAYGPLVGAVAFKKSMTFLMKHIKLKI